MILWQDVKYLAISGFLFLRFFAPAILTPKLFDLRDQHADPQTSRSLLLLAKVCVCGGAGEGAPPESAQLERCLMGKIRKAAWEKPQRKPVSLCGCLCFL